MRPDYKKAVDSGRKSGGGRVVFTFYNLRESHQGGSPAVERVSTGLDSADVQEEAESTDEPSERDDQEEASSLSEAGKNREECQLDETTKKRRATVTEMLSNRKDKEII